MTAEQERVDSLQRLTAAVIKVITSESGGVEDVPLVMGALGVAVGTIAQATGEPEESLEMMVKMARMVFDSELYEGIAREMAVAEKGLSDG